jgi:hypothetical protein
MRLEFLAKAGSALAESLDYEATLRAIGDLVVPSVSDFCTIDLAEGEGGSRKVMARHVDQEKQKLLQQLLGPQAPHMTAEPRHGFSALASPRFSRTLPTRFSNRRSAILLTARSFGRWRPNPPSPCRYCFVARRSGSSR